MNMKDYWLRLHAPCPPSRDLLSCEPISPVKPLSPNVSAYVSYLEEYKDVSVILSPFFVNPRSYGHRVVLPDTRFWKHPAYCETVLIHETVHSLDFPDHNVTEILNFIKMVSNGKEKVFEELTTVFGTLILCDRLGVPEQFSNEASSAGFKSYGRIGTIFAPDEVSAAFTSATKRVDGVLK